jgi:hypothetical protein
VSLVVDEHRQYLEDDTRVAAFRDALAEVVTPGAVVLDLGSGTGIQALLACRSGARHVYSIDSGGIGGLAREIARANGLTERVTVIRGLSTRLTLPEPVDVITGDQIGRFGFEAGLLDYWIDARDRFLKPGGTLIPSSIDLWAAPVELPDVWNRVAFWRHRPADFDFSPASEIAANTGYPAKAAARAVVAEPWRVATIDLKTGDGGVIRGETRTRITRSAVVHGLAGWFVARLSPGVTMTNSPLAESRIDRSHVFLPRADPLPVDAGDDLRIALHIIPGQLLITWNIDRADDVPARPQSTMRGMLLSREDLTKSAPTFIPRLTAWGRARQSVLELCDGRRQLQHIEQALYEAYPQLFPSRAHAAEFVAEVVYPYAE